MFNRRSLLTLFFTLFIAFSFMFALTPSAEVFQVSGSVWILPSSSDLTEGVPITATLRINNTSSDTTGPIEATFTGTLTVTLACTSSSCTPATELPGTLTYIPPCVPLVPDVVCTPSGNNKVLITVSNLTILPASGVDVVKLTLLPEISPCGDFYMRAESGVNDLTACDSIYPTICQTSNIVGSAMLNFPCPWELAYNILFDNFSDIEHLREFRDRFLAKTKRGKLYIRIIYKNSNEALNVLLDNPELMLEAKALIEENMNAVEEILNNNMSFISNTDEIISFLDKFAQKSPFALKLLVKSIKMDMLRTKKRGGFFFGMKLN